MIGTSIEGCFILEARGFYYKICLLYNPVLFSTVSSLSKNYNGFELFAKIFKTVDGKQTVDFY